MATFLGATMERRVVPGYEGRTMQTIRAWWNGLRPSDRRLAGICLSIIAVALPCYLAAAIILAADYVVRQAPSDEASLPSGPPTLARQTPPVSGITASPRPVGQLPSTPSATMTAGPTASPVPLSLIPTREPSARPA